eukprot:gnl/TRDRNA2_/TRDRNA2_193675_c0_seq1.p1 gnl/TRDRNA2_/TRDRNA2_193675_c0~~gnl/TRDRNA2_/TRDRNA2_193675_c0_seq1.p1  ORF type:complete len:470 (+),score=80.58 gnl/TRDRNA2_/TRDRNA2_193675_c0_seq1:59-1468(+)
MATKKKILFLPLGLKGHVFLTQRLTEWFAQWPEKYEVHVVLQPGVEAVWHQTVIIHIDETQISVEENASIFVNASLLGHDKLTAGVEFAEPLLEPDGQVVTAVRLGIAAIKEIKPDMVVAEHSFCLENHLPTFARKLGIPVVQLVPMQRPEVEPGLCLLLEVAWKQFGVFKRFVKVLGNLNSWVKEFGKPDKEKTLCIFPGSASMFELAPKSYEICAGHFCPIVPAGPTDPSQLSLGSGYESLQTWLLQSYQEKIPVVYIAFGTMVTPHPDLLRRLKEALDGGPWRILWALPEKYGKAMSAELESPQWYFMSFVPQIPVLESGIVKCFLSHCGASSTAESMTRGIPMVCLPFYGDQWEWADCICDYKKAGVKLNKALSSVAEIRAAVVEVLGNPSYGQRAAQIGEAVRSDAADKLKRLGLELSPTTAPGVPVAGTVIEAMMEGRDPKALFGKPSPPSDCFAGCSRLRSS